MGYRPTEVEKRKWLWLWLWLHIVKIPEIRLETGVFIIIRYIICIIPFLECGIIQLYPIMLRHDTLHHRFAFLSSFFISPQLLPSLDLKTTRIRQTTSIGLKIITFGSIKRACLFNQTIGTFRIFSPITNFLIYRHKEWGYCPLGFVSGSKEFHPFQRRLRMSLTHPSISCIFWSVECSIRHKQDDRNR